MDVSGSHVEHDLVLRGGRVIDPETGRDETADVAVTGTTITAIGTNRLHGRVVRDISGQVVAPGWIDLHSHAQSIGGLRLQAHDGVTTALELEAGACDVADAYRRAGAEGRPIHYGFSVSWQQARMIAVGHLDAYGDIGDALPHFGDPAWQRPAGPREHATLVDILERNLADGALGIGVLLGYAPELDPSEYLAVSGVAAAAGVPTFTHVRELTEQDEATPIDGASEIVAAADTTGVHAHYCHVNSTTLRHRDRVLDLLDRARAAGSTITTEAYPYGAGSTAIGAGFLAPELIDRRGLVPGAIVYVAEQRPVASFDDLRKLRAADPGGLAVIHYLHEDLARDRELLDGFATHPAMIVASDALQLDRGRPDTWPVAPAAVSHPRNAGTFSKFIRRYFRELGALSLMDAVARCSYLPARVLESSVPAFARKGRLQVGCDADLVVFEPQRVADRATYQAPSLTSVGYGMVMVSGTPVVVDDVLVAAAMPGEPIRR